MNLTLEILEAAIARVKQRKDLLITHPDNETQVIEHNFGEVFDVHYTDLVMVDGWYIIKAEAPDAFPLGIPAPR